MNSILFWISLGNDAMDAAAAIEIKHFLVQQVRMFLEKLVRHFYVLRNYIF